MHWGESPKSMNLPTDSSSVAQIVISFLTRINRLVKWRSYGDRLLEISAAFVANGYCVFENDICVDLTDVLGGEPDFANSPLLGFFAKARCPHVLAPSRVAAVEVYN